MKNSVDLDPPICLRRGLKIVYFRVSCRAVNTDIVQENQQRDKRKNNNHDFIRNASITSFATIITIDLNNFFFAQRRH